MNIISRVKDGDVETIVIVYSSLLGGDALKKWNKQLKEFRKLSVDLKKELDENGSQQIRFDD